MRFYADVTVRRDPREILHELESLALRQVRSDGNTAPSRILESARDGLILAGMLEQALVDNLLNVSASEAHPSDHDAAAQALTDWWADRMVAPNDAPSPPPTLPSMADFGPLSIVIPEGYLFYTLFPEVFAEIGRDLVAEWASSLYIVVGVLSIGASLSAALAAGLRRGGCVVARHTVRPVGDPFSREVVTSRTVAGAWKAAADRGARFVVVDEGPGLSGSSLAAVVEALRGAGVPAERIVVVCAHLPGPLPNASPAVRRTWASLAVRSVEPLIERLIERRLPILVGSACEVALSSEHEESWGNLSEARGTLLPGFERRKLFLRDSRGQRVVGRFVGFGAIGRRKAALTRSIAEAGMAPVYRGYAHGFLLQNWVDEGIPEGLDSISRSPIVDAAARYYAFVRQSAGSEVGKIDFRELSTTVEEIYGAWAGNNRPRSLVNMTEAASTACPRALAGDQRPERLEWCRAGDRVLKCATADHFLDHSWARDQDIAFDLAGFIDEWMLDSAERARFLAFYTRASGDRGAPDRIPFYRCVYNAHRLAMLDTAYHAGGHHDLGRLSQARQLVGERLIAALSLPAVPCA